MRKPPLWVGVALTSAVLVAALLALNSGESPRPVNALVPAGEVVSSVELWKGTSETSAEGNRVSVGLRIQPGETPVDAPEATLMNTGDQPIGYGYGFQLHRRVSGLWEPVRDRSVVQGIELHLDPAEKSESEAVTVTRRIAGWSHLLGPGEYLLTKAVRPASNQPWRSGTRPPAFDVSARFLIED
jgi:hypothetical protein